MGNSNIPNSPDSPTENKKAVLIIEDDLTLSKMYQQKFEIEGYRVLTAFNGEMGLRLALEENVGIIILDIMLPRMTGIVVLETLRQSKTAKDLPVIALTNLAKDEEKKRAIELGVKEYLVKAMQTPEEVVKKVKQYMA